MSKALVRYKRTAAEISTVINQRPEGVSRIRALASYARNGLIRYVGIGSGDYFLSNYGTAPRAMRENLMYSNQGINIRWHARRAARSNEYIKRFLSRARQTAFFNDRVEVPTFRDAPEEIAKMVGYAWANYWRTAKDHRGRVIADAERLHFRDWLVDGEMFFDFPNGDLRAIPSDMIDDHIEGAGDYFVETWITTNGEHLPASAIIQSAIVESNWQLRGVSYLAPALPELFWEMEYRDNSGQGIRDLSKIGAVTENQGTGSAHGLPPVGGFDAVDSGGNLPQSANRDRFRGSVPGMVIDLKTGEKFAAPGYGPPENARMRADVSISKIAIALGVSETELTGDHVKHNFASLQVAEARDMKTYMDLRQTWYTVFRYPVFKEWLMMKIGDGTLPPVVFTHFDQLIPRWSGPKLKSAQPLKDAQALRAEAEMGQVNLRQIAASQGENAEKNAADNANILSIVKQAENPDPDGNMQEKLDMLLDNAK